ncbi:unnamed protein product [Cylicocyclus nassatus]|uniref:Uncharacterized protein n=1 Tax=Cylicocyclus nassatus TaxID=53992 RepID=A0AA36DKF5_CYLNA|nr:unnamed protein product [Cylicocyclus nassatus]
MARKNNDSQYIPTHIPSKIHDSGNVKCFQDKYCSIGKTSSALLENEKSNTKLQASPRGWVRVPLQWLAKTTILNIYPPIFLQNFTIPETSNVSRTSSALLESEKSNTKLQASPRGWVRVPLQWLAKTTILNIYPPIFLQKFTIPGTSNVSRTSTALLESEKSNTKLQASPRGRVRVPLQWLAKTTILNIYPPIFLQKFTIPETSNASRTSTALLESEKSNTKLQASPRGRVRVPLQWLAKTTILNIYPPIFLQKFMIPETSNASRTSTALLESEKSNTKLQASPRGRVRVPLQWLAKTTILNIYPPIFLQKFTIPETSNASRTSTALLESEKSNTKLQASPRGRDRVPLQWLAKTTILNIYPPIFLQKFMIPETSNASRTSTALLESEKSNTKLQASPRGRVRVPLQWLAKTTILNIYPPIFLQKFTIPETSNASRTSTALLESEKSNTKLQASPRGRDRVPLQWLAKTTILNIYPPIFLQKFMIPETSNASRTSTALLESEKSNTKLQASPRGRASPRGWVRVPLQWLAKTTILNIYPPIFLQNFTIPETSNVSRTSSALLESEKSNTKLQASPRGWVRVPLQWLAKTTILNIYPPIFLQKFTIPGTSNVFRTSTALLESEKSNTKLQASPRGRVRVPLQWLAKTTILNIYPPIFLQKFTIPETSNASRTSTALLESEKSNTKLQASPRGRVRVPLQWLAKTTILNIYPPIFLQKFMIPETSNASRTSTALLESEKSNTKLQASPRGWVRVPLQWLAKTTILNIYPPIFLQNFTIPETSNVSRTSSALLESEKSNTKLQASPRGWVRVPLQWLAKTTILNIYPPIFLQNFTIPETSNVSRTSSALLESEKSNTKLQASPRGWVRVPLQWLAKTTILNIYPPIFLQKFTIPGTSNVSRTSTALLESEKSNTKLQASPRGRVRVPLQWLAKTTILNIYPPIFLQKFTIPGTSNVSRTSTALLESEKSNTKLQASPRGRVRVPLQWLAKTTILNIYPPIFLQKFMIPETSNASRTSTALLESEKSNTKLQASPRGRVRVPLQWLAKTTILNIYPPIFLQKFTIPETSNASRTSTALLESEKSNTKLQASPRGRDRVPLQWLAKTTILNKYPPVFLQKFMTPETSNASRTSTALLESEKSNTKLQASPRGLVLLYWKMRNLIQNSRPVPEAGTSSALLESEKSNTKLQASPRGWVRVPLQWLAKTTILNIYPPIFLQNFTIPETSNVSRTSSALLESEKSNTKLQASPRGWVRVPLQWLAKTTILNIYPPIFLQKFTIPGTSNVSRTSTALLESEKSNTKLQASPRGRVRVPLQWLAKTTIFNIYPPIFLQKFTIPETSNASRTSTALLESEKSNTKLQASPRGRVRVPLQWLAKTTILNIYPPIFLQKFMIPETSNASRTSTALLESEKSNTKLQASPRGRVRVPLQWLAKTTILNIYPPIFLQKFTIPETSNASRTSTALLESEKSNTKLQASPRGRDRVPLQWLAKTTILNIYPPIFLQKFMIPETSNASRTSTALLESEKSNTKLQASPRGWVRVPLQWLAKTTILNIYPPIFLQKFTIPGTSNVFRTSTALLESEKSNTKLQASPRGRVRVPLQWLAKTTILNIYPPIFLQKFTIPETSNASRTSTALLESEKSNTKLQASPRGRVRVPLQWLAKTTILNIYPPIFLQKFMIPETSNASRTSTALLESEKSNTKLQASPRGRVRVPLQWLAKTTILNIYPPIFLQKFTIPETSNASRTSTALLESEKSNTKLQASPRGRDRVPLQWLAKTTILNKYPPVFLQKFMIPETSNASRTSTALLESEKSNTKLQASPRGLVLLYWKMRNLIQNSRPVPEAGTSSALLENEKSNTKLQASPRGWVRVPLQWLAKTTILNIYPPIFLQNFTIPETSNVSRTSSALLESEKSNTKLQASPRGWVRVPLQWLAKTTILNIYPPIFLQKFTIPGTSNVSRTSTALLESEKSNTKLQASPRGRVRVPLQWLAKTTILNIYPPIFLQKFTIPETSNASRTSTALLESEKSNTKLQASPRGRVRVPLQWLAKTTILNIYPPIFLQKFMIPETSNASRTSTALLESEKSNTKLQASPRGRVRVPLQWLAKTTILNIYPPIFLQKFTIPETSNVSRTSSALLESEKSNTKLQASPRGWVRVPLQWLAKTTILNIYPPIFLQKFTIPGTSNVSRTSTALLESEKSNTKLQASPRGWVRVPLQWLAKTTILNIYPPIFLQNFTIPETSNVSRTSSALLESEISNTKLQASPRGWVRVPLQWLAKTTILNIYPPIFLQKFTIPGTSNVFRTSTALLESEKSNTKLQASPRGLVLLYWKMRNLIQNSRPVPEAGTSSALLENEKSNTKLQASPRGWVRVPLQWLAKTTILNIYPPIFLQNFTIPETSNVSRTSSALLESEKSNTKLQASPRGWVRVPLQWLAKTTILNIYPPIFLQKFTIPGTSNVSRTSTALLESEKSNTKLQASPRGRVRVPLQWLAKTTILNIYPPIFLQKFTIPETSNASRTSTALLESEKSNTKLQASPRGRVRVPLQWLAKTTILNIYPPIFLQKFMIPETSNASRTSTALLESEKSNTKLQASPRGRVRVPLQWLAKTTILNIYPPIFLQKFTIPETSNVSRTSSALLESEKSNTKLQASPRGWVRVPLQWLAKTTILNIYPPIFLQKFTIPGTSNVSRTSTALLESEKSNTKLQASPRGRVRVPLQWLAKTTILNIYPPIFLQKFTIPETSNASRTSTALLESEKSNTKLQASPRGRVRVPLQWLAKTTILNIYPPIFLQKFMIPETSNASRTSTALLESEKSNTKLQASPRGRVRVPLQWLAKTTILNIYPPIFLQKFTIPETSNASRTSTALLESEKSNTKLQASPRGRDRVPLQWLAKTTILNIYPPIFLQKFMIPETSNASRTSTALLESEKSNTKLQASPRGRASPRGWVRVPLQWLAKTTILNIYPPIFLQNFTIPETSNVSRTSSALLESEKSNTKLQASPRGWVRVPLQWLAKTTILNIYPPIFLQKFTIPGTSNVFRTSTALLESEKSNTKLQASPRGRVRVPLQWLAKTTILNIYPPIFLQKFTIPETSNASRTSTALLESEKSNTKLQASPRGRVRVPLQWLAKTTILNIYPPIFLQKFMIPETSNASRTSTALLESEKSNTKLQASPRGRVRVPLQWLAKTTILNIYPPIFLQKFTIPETSNASRTSTALLESEKSNTKLQASPRGRDRVPLQWLAKTTILNKYPPVFLQKFMIPETSNASRTSTALLESEKSNTKLQASPRGLVLLYWKMRNLIQNSRPVPEASPRGWVRVPLQWLAKTTILNIYPPIFLQNFTIPETSNVSRTSSALLESEKSNTKLQASPRGWVRVPLQWLAKTTILNIYPPIFLQNFTIPETSNVSRTSSALLESEKSNTKLQASPRGWVRVPLQWLAKTTILNIYPPIFLQKFTIPGTSNVSRTSTALLESEKSNTKLQASPRGRVRVPLQWLAKTTILNIYPPIFLQKFTIPETSNASRTSTALLESEKSNTKLQASPRGRVRVPLQWLAKTTILNIYPPIFLQKFMIPETSNASRTSTALLESEKSNTKLQASPRGRVRVPLQWLAKTTILNIYPPIFLQKFTIPETSNASRTSTALLESEKSNTKLQASPRGRDRVPLQWLAKTTILNKYPPIFLQKFMIPETSNASRTSTALLESEKSNTKLQASPRGRASPRGWVRVPLQWLAKTTILNIYPPIFLQNFTIPETSNVSRTSSALLESEKSNTKLQASPRGWVRVPLQWLAKTTILNIYPPIFLQNFTIPETSNVSRTSSALLESEKSNTKLQASPRGWVRVPLQWLAKTTILNIYPPIFLQKFTIPGTSNVSRTSTALLESEKSNTKLQASPRGRVRVPLQWLAKTTILNIYPPIFLQKFTIPETSNASRTSTALLESEKSNTKLQASPRGRVRVPLQWLAKTTILNIYPPIFLQKFMIPETSNASRTSTALLESEKSNTKLQASPRGRVRVPLQWLAKTTILNIYPPIFLQKFTIPETSNASRTSTALLESEKSNTKLQASPRGRDRVPLQWLAKTTILNKYPPIFLQKFMIPETSNASRTSTALLESEKSNTKLQASPRGRVRVPLQWLAKTTILNIYPPIFLQNFTIP